MFQTEGGDDLVPTEPVHKKTCPGPRSRWHLAFHQATAFDFEAAKCALSLTVTSYHTLLLWLPLHGMLTLTGSDSVPIPDRQYTLIFM